MADVIVDTNILLDLFTQDTVWAQRSAQTLMDVANSSALVINPIIYAELSVGFSRIEDLNDFIGSAFRRDPLPWNAAFLAGKVFLSYRKKGGLKTAPMPDFYIGAHAAVNGMHIITRDPRRYRSYFPGVVLIEP